MKYVATYLELEIDAQSVISYIALALNYVATYLVVDIDGQSVISYEFIDERLDANQFSHMSAILNINSHHHGKGEQHIGTNILKSNTNRKLYS